jgi:hypothetical protein
MYRVLALSNGKVKKWVSHLLTYEQALGMLRVLEDQKEKKRKADEKRWNKKLRNQRR